MPILELSSMPGIFIDDDNPLWIGIDPVKVLQAKGVDTSDQLVVMGLYDGMAAAYVKEGFKPELIQSDNTD